MHTRSALQDQLTSLAGCIPLGDYFLGSQGTVSVESRHNGHPNHELDDPCTLYSSNNVYIPLPGIKHRRILVHPVALRNACIRYSGHVVEKGMSYFRRNASVKPG